MGKVLFRAGVVIAVRHPLDGRLLAFERRDVPGPWQLPQGGIEGDETPIHAAYRELGEETGLAAADVVLVGEYPEWLAYEWPEDVQALKARNGRGRANGGRVIGQVHRWFFFEAASPGIVPVPDLHEFRDWQWAEVDWLVDNVAPMRRSSYQTALG